MGCVECGAGLPQSTGRGRPRRYCSRGCQGRAYRRRRDHGRTAPARRPARRPARVRDAEGARTRDELIRVAVRLADADGLDAVSIRCVADRAGVAAEAAYRWVRNRDDLLGAMAERVLARARTRPAGGTPRERLEGLARAEWSLYRRHPWLLAVLARSRPPIGPAVLAVADAAVDALVDAGHEPRNALAGYLALSGYVQGMALLHVAERAERDAGSMPWGAWSARTFSRVRRAGWLAAVQAGSDADHELEQWFAFGLARLLDGLVA
ncbi:TetR/AcrR family transcriptional regulator [Asanoa sp. WMMD1127]|uniref:TetR/AcrR family transcriptional regulator n=1 Tax=Asanoa sp. WMMD1127 TaxID=3016107 RepID=UPI0024175274|nr:TetR/AcrR family transcriptional regulator [Asanoa sp. WMMD1127]MDG4824316.1 TetR/AcrR family transcriptional regulator [Asanoa sp. WMMD1127]